MRVSYDEQIKGRTVIDANGRSIGQLEELFLDDDSIPIGLRVSSIRVKLHSAIADEVGLPRGAFHPAILEIPALALQAFGDAIILNVNIASLVPNRPKEAPQAP